MSDPLFDLMHALAGGVLADATSADALFLIADEAERTGQADVANAVRNVARMHRAKAIEHQARLGTLRFEYGERSAFDPS